MSKLLRNDLNYAHLWLALAVVSLALMLFISVNARIMNAIDDVTDDWVVHILGFMVITIAFCGPLQQRYRTKVFAAFLACGVLIELIQLGLPGRTASLTDMSANLVGLGMGWFFLRSRYGDWCMWLETRLGLQ